MQSQQTLSLDTYHHDHNVTQAISRSNGSIPGPKMPRKDTSTVIEDDSFSLIPIAHIASNNSGQLFPTTSPEEETPRMSECWPPWPPLSPRRQTPL